jgi:antitoxin (DNA-binding transcriptional repressor) of toxin-antitoxin stability system
MKIVKVHQAKTTLSRLIEQALAGEEVVIARGDTPVVRLVPVDVQPLGRVFGALKGKLQVTEAFFKPLPPDELAGWDA